MEKETKRCSRCGEIKPISEFYKSKTSKDGLMSECKECHKELRKEYYKNHRENELKKQAEWRANNKEKKAAYDAEWRSNNNEKWKAYNAEYRDPILSPMGYARYMVAHYRQMDRQRGFDPSQTITAEWFVQNIMYKPCAHCGLLQVGAIGVNRKSNALGHIPSNCEPCCRNCNSRLGAIDQIERGLAWFQKREKVDFKTFVNEHKAKHKNLA